MKILQLKKITKNYCQFAFQNEKNKCEIHTSTQYKMATLYVHILQATAWCQINITAGDMLRNVSSWFNSNTIKSAGITFQVEEDERGRKYKREH